MTQQTLMERVIVQPLVRAVGPFHDDHGNLIDISRWVGVECNAAGDVVSIIWSLSIGTLDLKLAPETVRILRIVESSEVCGSVDFYCLPRDLVVLHIGAGLEGEIRLGKLPKNLIDLQIFQVHFTGVLMLKDIPDKVMCVGVNEQHISRFDMRTDSTALGQNIDSLCGMVDTLDFKKSARVFGKLVSKTMRPQGRFNSMDFPRKWNHCIYRKRFSRDDKSQ